MGRAAGHLDACSTNARFDVLLEEVIQSLEGGSAVVAPVSSQKEVTGDDITHASGNRGIMTGGTIKTQPVP